MSELSVTYRFVVELTDFVEFDWPLFTEEEARDVLKDVLYRGDKHSAYVLTLKETLK